ncbi:MAG: tetratricopeptide repeat protein [Chloroflexi bacterium]|nr:tetratricopeptide repeat protein [Chloroflexota bacterium]
MQCPKCQTQNPIESNFCQHCGWQFGFFCWRCANQLRVGANFCNRCGAPASQPRAEGAPAPASQNLAIPSAEPSPALPSNPPAIVDPSPIDRYLPADLAAKLEVARQSGTEGERRIVTILFCDIKGSTAAAETESLPILSIRTLGGAAVEVRPGFAANSSPLHFATRTTEALLLYLACQGRAVSRDLLVELLWPERSQEQARANLRLALHRLRRQIDPFLTVTRQSVGLNFGAVIECDVTAFEKHLAAGQPEEATALYRGDFLDGFYLDDSPTFEQWALLERERLRTLALAAWQQRIEQRVADGQLQAGMEGARRLLQLDPLHEPTHRQLMRLLAQTGQRSAALAQYESCRHLLATELDVTPDETTTALAEQIREGVTSWQGDTVTRWQGDRMTGRSPLHLVTLSPLHALLPQPTPFIGRERELAQVENLLTNPDCRLLTLLGVGGIGKTRLALESAARLAGDFAHGVCFVPLTPVETTTLLTVAIAQSLGIQNTGNDLLAQVANYLQPRQLLLVLDNFDHLVDEAETVAHLLQRAPRLKVLITSRQRLAILEEWLLPVSGLSSQSGLSDEAGQLFLRTVQRARPDFVVDGQEEIIHSICQQVEGMPLALELAASWVRVMPCAAIAQQIAHNLDFLTTGLRNLPERHRSLRGLFDQSWRLLSPDEQRVLRRVSLFRGGWALDEARAVAEATLPLLVGLVDKSLVRADPHGRFDMHELVRQYAAEQLQASGEGDLLRQRHFTAYLQLACAADARLRGPSAALWYARIDAERDNIRAAWEWALMTENFVDAAWLGVGLSHFWSVHLDFQEALYWFEQLLPHRQRLPHDLRLAVLLALYHFWRGQDDFASIDGYMDELRQLQEGSANRCLQAVAWRCMGVASADFAQALDHWDRCIGLLREAGDPFPVDNTYSAYSDSGYQLAFALFRYAIRLIDTGDYGAAERFSAESLALFRRRENRDYIVAPLGNLGRLALLRGDLAQARLLLQEAVAIARSVGNVLGLIDWLPRLGIATLYSGEVGEAQRLLQESLELSRTISSPMYLAWNYTYLAETALWQGDHEQAGQWLAQALAHHANPRWIRTETVDCLWVAARLATAQEQYQQAAMFFGLAEEMGRRIGYRAPGPVRPHIDAALATVQAALEPALFAESFAAGQQMTLAEAFPSNHQNIYGS